jgi:hypothetical protein
MMKGRSLILPSQVEYQFNGITSQPFDVSYSADDPIWDCTDFAHPAWWRGQEQCALRIAEIINEVIDEKRIVMFNNQPLTEALLRVYRLAHE